jgi:hypothetical protein
MIMTEKPESQRVHRLRRFSTAYLKERLEWTERYVEELKALIKEREKP